MESSKFEKVDAKKKKDLVKSRKKHILAQSVTVLLVAALLFIFAGCTSSCNSEKEDPNAGAEIENPAAPAPDDSEKPNTAPDDPEIPEGPEIPDEPEDIPPEDVPPQDNPPGGSDTSDFPKSIYEVDEVDEINLFADEFIQILNENYMDDLAKQFIGRNGVAEDIDSAEWYITNSNGKDQIKELQVKVYYDYSYTKHFKVGKVTFNKEYSVQDIIKGNATDLTQSVAYQNSSVTIDNIEANLALGKTVIQTIDPDNTLEGDIWCSIGSASPSSGKTYRPITVYQITDNGVEKYYMVAKAPSSKPESIIANIESGKYTTTSQSTEYTFSGKKIEQTSKSSQNLASREDEIES